MAHTFLTATYMSRPRGPKNMQAIMHGTTARCGTPDCTESSTKNREVHRSKTMKCAHPASAEVASENMRLRPSVVLNEPRSTANIASENSTYASTTYSREYATAIARVMVLVCLQRGRNTREIHAGRLPRLHACKTWLWVRKGRKGIGPATATAAPLALAAARDAQGNARASITTPTPTDIALTACTIEICSRSYTEGTTASADARISSSSPRLLLEGPARTPVLLELSPVLPTRRRCDG
mmetsp:Transcript_2697/g.4295  ORF Transcript_2697/g.4295 Transcript_2697/m.4295 type:complete len:240 (+) Transcript_2697:262-981(+)